MEAKYLSCIPIFTVKDPAKARDFYVDKLGFKVLFEWGSPITYLGLERNNVCVHLNSESNSRQEPGGGSISVITDEVDNLYAHCINQGVEITIAPDDRPYGLRDFGVKDVDGNIINFGCEVK